MTNLNHINYKQIKKSDVNNTTLYLIILGKTNIIFMLDGDCKKEKHIHYII